MASNTSNKGLLIVIIILLLIVIAVGGYMAYRITYQQVPLTPTVTSAPTKEQPNTPSDQQPTLSQLISPKIDNDKEAIIKAMASKHDKPISKVNITISQNTGTHAKGGVTFEGEMGGAMWLATTEQGIWTIVFDGNGVVPCADIAPYNFPVDMMPTCFDESVGDIINR